jgi:hypothetical protein
MNDQDPSETEMRRVCTILETIAKAFPEDSNEANAIRDAALAYTVVYQHETLKKRYESLRLAFGGELTDEMRADLRRHGIEPDDLDDDAPSCGNSEAE